MCENLREKLHYFFQVFLQHDIADVPQCFDSVIDVLRLWSDSYLYGRCQ